MRLYSFRSGHAWACTRLRGEEGIALILVIAIVLALTITLTTVIFLTTAGTRDSQAKSAQQKAYNLAESGINNALSVLYQNYPGTVGFPGDPTLLPQRTTTYSTGSVTWSGSLNIAPDNAGWGVEWDITSVGSVKNPTGPNSGAVTRKLTAVVPVVIPIKTPVGNNNPLNFIYSNLDLTFQQSVRVASPVYATRDLILQNTSAVSEWIGNSSGSPNRLAVGRNFYELQNANTVGHVNGTGATNVLGEVHIVGQCSTKAFNTTLHNCSFGNNDQIWATTADNTIPADFLTFIPQLTCCAPFPDVASLSPTQTGGGWSNIGGAYVGANLSPKQGCSIGSVPFSFGSDDNAINNDATPAGSPAINLTPNASYSCFSANGGELSWNNSTHKLRVQGTIYIDGSATITSGPMNQATVTGQGVIFLTGTFMMKNALMCVKTTGSGNNTHCDTSNGAWDPNVGALIIVADGDGGYDSTQNQSNNVISGQGISLKSSDFQGGLIANKDINVDTTSIMQGPMISVYHNVIAGQSNTLTFPPLEFAPGGGGEIGPTPTPTLLTPRQFGGG